MAQNIYFLFGNKINDPQPICVHAGMSNTNYKGGGILRQDMLDEGILQRGTVDQLLEVSNEDKNVKFSLNADQALAGQSSVHGSKGSCVS